ncbi:ParA family protein [uncultured Duncaniella sp.]|uniref:ParA family protein n=1 Tax=uncultured Duncaniella sp. TaxID=2768039 RepID=UPI0025A98E68|nr:ParA family protein [uncultured Duncaniella sp.]
MESPTYVAFATQKGGVGKSTLTTLVASYLYYAEGVELVAVDCDSSQHSMNVYRDHDLVVTKENPYLKRALHRFYLGFEKKPYEIILTSPKDALDVVDNYVDNAPEEKKPSVVFFDITGTINNPGIVDLISNMDYLFVPITTETGEMASSISFASAVVNNMMTVGTTKIKELRLVWNKINSREKTRLCDVMDNYMQKHGLSSLDTVLVKSNKFEKDGRETGNTGIFRSTMLPPDKRLIKGTNLEELVSEIREIIKV